MSEQIIIFSQIVFIDLVLAGDNAIIGMVASKFPQEEREEIIGNRWSRGFKNYSYFVNCLFASNYRFKIDWRHSSSLHSLQTLQRCN